MNHLNNKQNPPCLDKHLKTSYSLKLFTFRFVCFNIYTSSEASVGGYTKRQVNDLRLYIRLLQMFVNAVCVWLHTILTWPKKKFLNDGQVYFGITHVYLWMTQETFPFRYCQVGCRIISIVNHVPQRSGSVFQRNPVGVLLRSVPHTQA